VKHAFVIAASFLFSDVFAMEACRVHPIVTECTGNHQSNYDDDCEKRDASACYQASRPENKKCACFALKPLFYENVGPNHCESKD